MNAEVKKQKHSREEQSFYIVESNYKHLASLIRGKRKKKQITKSRYMRSDTTWRFHRYSQYTQTNLL